MNRSVSYPYDPVGNHQQVAEKGTGVLFVQVGYTANNLDRYTVVDGSLLGYDGNDNLNNSIAGVLANWTCRLAPVR